MKGHTFFNSHLDHFGDLVQRARKTRGGCLFCCPAFRGCDLIRILSLYHQEDYPETLHPWTSQGPLRQVIKSLWGKGTISSPNLWRCPRWDSAAGRKPNKMKVFIPQIAILSYLCWHAQAGEFATLQAYQNDYSRKLACTGSNKVVSGLEDAVIVNGTVFSGFSEQLIASAVQNRSFWFIGDSTLYNKARYISPNLPRVKKKGACKQGLHGSIVCYTEEFDRYPAVQYKLPTGARKPDVIIMNFGLHSLHLYDARRMEHVGLQFENNMHKLTQYLIQASTEAAWVIFNCVKR